MGGSGQQARRARVRTPLPHRHTSHLPPAPPQRSRRGDTHEGLYFGRHVEEGSPEAALPLHGPNQWPDEALVPGYRAATEAYQAAVEALGFRLLRLLALSLGLGADHFAPSFTRPMVFLRPLHYRHGGTPGGWGGRAAGAGQRGGRRWQAWMWPGVPSSPIQLSRCVTRPPACLQRGGVQRGGRPVCGGGPQRLRHGHAAADRRHAGPADLHRRGDVARRAAGLQSLYCQPGRHAPAASRHCGCQPPRAATQLLPRRLPHSRPACAPWPAPLPAGGPMGATAPRCTASSTPAAASASPCPSSSVGEAVAGCMLCKHVRSPRGRCAHNAALLPPWLPLQSPISMPVWRRCPCASRRARRRCSRPPRQGPTSWSAMLQHTPATARHPSSPQQRRRRPEQLPRRCLEGAWCIMQFTTQLGAKQFRGTGRAGGQVVNAA